MTRALLIVDVQNDFTEGGALGVAGGAAVASGVSEFLRTQPDDYALVVASRDWHDATGGNGGHFAAPGDEPDFVTTWPVHCVAGTPGADYHPGLVARIDVHIRKGMGVPAYSAFEGVVAGEADRPLVDVLREAGVTDLDVVGIATDYCVRASALDAVEAGFAVRVLTELVAGVAPESSAAALDELRGAGVALV